MTDDEKQKLTPRTVQLATAKYLAGLAARPDGLIKLSDILAGVRVSSELSPKQRAKLNRQHVTDALNALGVLTGIHEKTYHAIGYSLDAPPTLTVDDSGRVREAE